MAKNQGHANNFSLKYRHIHLESSGKLLCLLFEASRFDLGQLFRVPGNDAFAQIFKPRSSNFLFFVVLASRCHFDVP